MLLNYISIDSIIIIRALEESPKFLIQKKRVEAAIKAITRVNRFSGDKVNSIRKE